MFVTTQRSAAMARAHASTSQQRPRPLAAAVAARRRPLAAAVVVRASSAGPPEQQQQPETAAPQTTTTATPATPATTAAPPSAGGGGGGLGAAAAAAGVALFLTTRFLSGGAGASLAALESASLPLDDALRNGRPTLVEFYAPWCEACRELGPVESKLERRFGDSVNFVMLNVDNPLWQQEVEEFGVSGIPHFVFMDQAGKPLAAAVGRVPGSVLEANVAAMAESGRGRIELPYLAARAEASALQGPAVGGVGVNAAAPRAHA